MPNLPLLLRAACGHYVPVKQKPVGIDEDGFKIVLCDACRTALKRPKIERKA